MKTEKYLIIIDSINCKLIDVIREKIVRARVRTRGCVSAAVRRIGYSLREYSPRVAQRFPYLARAARSFCCCFQHLGVRTYNTQPHAAQHEKRHTNLCSLFIIDAVLRSDICKRCCCSRFIFSKFVSRAIVNHQAHSWINRDKPWTFWANDTRKGTTHREIH